MVFCTYFYVVAATSSSEWAQEPLPPLPSPPPAELVELHGRLRVSTFHRCPLLSPPVSFAAPSAPFNRWLLMPACLPAAQDNARPNRSTKFLRVREGLVFTTTRRWRAEGRVVRAWSALPTVEQELVGGTAVVKSQSIVA